MFWRRNAFQDPLWRDFQRLTNAFDRFERGFGTPRRNIPAWPAMNLWTGEETAALTAELPGFAPEDLDIDVDRETITISGERKHAVDEDGWVRRERAHGRFERSLTLPFEIDPETVEATLENGVLTVTLHRAESSKPKRIAVQTS